MEELIESLQAYANIGRPTGDFLRAVLENNLMEAFGRADIFNRGRIFEICQFIYNELPSNSHGSKEKVDAWLKMKQLERENVVIHNLHKRTAKE